MDAVTEYLDFEKDADARRAAEDLEYWKNWKQSGMQPRKLMPLMKRFKPMIVSRSAPYIKAGVQVHPVAIQAEFKKQLVNAFKEYKPEKGTLGTFVYSYLNASKRFISMHQNMARIPENRTYRIGAYQRAKEYLATELDKEPSPKQIARHLKWNVRDVAMFGKELRKDLRMSKFDVESTFKAPKYTALLQQVRQELTPRELKVYTELVQNSNVKGKDLARKLKLSPSTVSKIRSQIAKKIERYK